MIESDRKKRLLQSGVKPQTPEGMLITLSEKHRVKDSLSPEVISASLRVAALSAKLRETKSTKPHA